MPVRHGNHFHSGSPDFHGGHHDHDGEKAHGVAGHDALNLGGSQPGAAVSVYQLLASATGAAAQSPPFREDPLGPISEQGGVDAPGNTSTTEVLVVGSSVGGSVGFSGDADWYAVTLTAGQSYLFTLNGTGSPALSDPFIRLYGPGGNQIAFNDDGGPGLNSALRFTPTESGVYYVSAQAYSTETGQYSLSANAVAPQDPLDTIDWGAAAASTQVRIYFATPGQSFLGFTATTAWTAPEIAAVLAAGAVFSSYTDLTFVQVSSAAEATMIMIQDSSLEAAGLMTTPPASPTIGVFLPVYLDQSLAPGSFGFALLLHEMGHGLGLAHPHDDGGTSEVMEGVYDDDLLGPWDLNQGVFTMMSYNDGHPSVGGGNPTGLSSGYQASPMALDVAVLQANYGAPARNTGDTTYTLESAAGRYTTIWDTGGIDTIIYSGTNRVIIDLRPATLLSQEGGGGFVSRNRFMSDGQGGFTIAAGVVIENATGGSGDDRLTGNDADNILWGRGGSDVLDGGAGSDTAVYSDATGVLSIILGENGASGSGGGDTLISIENIVGGSFDDVIRQNAVDNRLDGGDGNDTVSYQSAAAAVSVNLALTGAQNTGGGGFDTLISIENLVGTAFNDNLVGNAGANVLDGALGDDVLDGGAGDDTASYASIFNGVTVSLAIAGAQATGGAGTDTLISIENLTGGNGSDVLIGNASANRLSGLGGNDVLAGNGGSDVLDGGAGNDIVDFRHMGGPVTLDLSLIGGQAALGGDTVTLISIEGVLGTAFNDTLLGTDGVNFLDGGAGDDFLDGRGGRDMASYANATGSVTVSLRLTGPQNTGMGIDTLLNIESVAGGEFDDVLYGSLTEFGEVHGNGGNDIIHGAFTHVYGGAGDDIVYGSDRLWVDGGEGDDTVSFELEAAGVRVDLTGRTFGVSSFPLWTSVETFIGSDHADFFFNVGTGAEVFAGGGDDTLSVGRGSGFSFDGGAGIDTAVFREGPVTVNLENGAASYSLGSYSFSSIENVYTSNRDDVIYGNELDNVIYSHLGNDLIHGGGGNDTAIFSGQYSTYSIVLDGDEWIVTGPDGIDRLQGIEFLQFSDRVVRLDDAGIRMDFSADNPARQAVWALGESTLLQAEQDISFMSWIRDFDGNDLGAAESWRLIGSVDTQGDGDLEYIYVNNQNGRWASVGPAEDGLVYFSDHGWGGDTRVVGIYIDPLVESGDVVQGSDHDSQRRFQNDLLIGNIDGILGAGDYDDDGLQEVYFSLTDGTAYLHAYMHADGNIRYANYQSEEQVIDFLTTNGFGAETYEGWFD